MQRCGGTECVPMVPAGVGGNSFSLLELRFIRTAERSQCESGIHWLYIIQ